MNAPLKGIWVDDAPRLVLMDSYLRELQELGVQTVALMMEDVVNGRRTWSAAQVRDATAALIARDIEVILTFAPTSTKVYLDRLESFVATVADCGIAGIEGDKEGRWNDEHLAGFQSLRQASDRYLEIMARFVERYDLRTELTTHTGHQEHGPRALTTPRVDRGVMQWYSVRKRNGRIVEWCDKYGPKQMQQFGASRWKKIPKNGDKPRLSVGLAAWEQRWPGHTTDESMRLAYDTALMYDPVEIRWWGSTHIIGAKQNPYAAKFIRGI